MTNVQVERSPGGVERRQSPRVPMHFLVRRSGAEGDFEARPGDLSLGGFASRGQGLELGALVEVRFSVPGTPGEVHARGEVMRESVGPDGVMTQVRFVELSLDAELAIAQHLHDRELTGPAS